MASRILLIINILLVVKVLGIRRASGPVQLKMNCILESQSARWIGIKMIGLKAVTAGICLLSVAALANSNTELGTVVPGTPSSASWDQTFLSGLISAYNVNQNPRSWQVPGLQGNPGYWTYTLNPGSSLTAGLPTLNGSYQLGNMTGISGSSSVTLSLAGITSDYITIKWGQDFEAYYVHGLTGSVTLNNDVNGNGISGFTYWNEGPGQVPDGGSTVALLGLGLGLLGLLARRFNLA
jgi:hypothetical protein